MAKKKEQSAIVKSILEKVVEKREKGVRGVSYSQFTTYVECPKHWDLKYRQGNYFFSSTISTVFGSALHACIQEWLNLLYTSTVKASDEYSFEEKLQEHLMNTYKKEKEANNNKHFSTLEELNEFYEDGLAILKYLRRKRKKLFDTEYTELVGHEVVLNTEIFEGNSLILFNGFLDTVFIEKKLGNAPGEFIYHIIIFDYKSSKSGWSERYELKDEKKLNQIRLYKHFFAKQFGWPIENITGEYKVLKRKVNTVQIDGWDMETPRLQTVSPSQGAVKIGQAVRALQDFVADCFYEDGSHQEKEYKAKPGNACKFCEFRNTEHCQLGV